MNVGGLTTTARLLAILLGLGVLVVLPMAPAYAAESLTLAKTATANVLVGGQASVTLTATNGGDVPDYNLSFRDQLPAGVTYVAGSTTPAQLGEPTVVTGGAPARQTLVWANVSDLPVGAVQALTFKVTIDPTAHPVGDFVDNSGQAYANSDPRTIPKFDATGSYTTGATAIASSTAARTSISAIQVRKSEPSPEHELLRGIHHHPTRLHADGHQQQPVPRQRRGARRLPARTAGVPGLRDSRQHSGRRGRVPRRPALSMPPRTSRAAPESRCRSRSTPSPTRPR